MINRRQLLKGATFASLLAASAKLVLSPGMAFAQDKPLKKWRHCVIRAKGDAGFFYIAKDRGFWEAHGLDVEIIEMKGSKDVMRVLLAGEADSSDLPVADIIPVWEKGGDIHALGGTLIGFPYAIYARKGIASWEELADKTFGTSSPGAAPHIFALAMLEAKGIPIDNIKIANAGGSVGRIRALAAGTLDATAASTEFVPDVDELGVKLMGLAKDDAPMFPRFVLTMTGNVLKDRFDDAAQFAAGYMEGLRYAASHRQDTIEVAAERTNGDPSDSRYSYSYDEIVDNGMISFDMEMPMEKIVWMRDMMFKSHLIDSKFDLAPYLDTRVREAALPLVREKL
ncbi:MAG: ABC transporter substrate-binding protein [Rhodospirillum sp.]|nr:ABC transporter substrate-binding protein [Rhodospirillum sp.]MCF8489486.1 ABC transporter substrate-binding protein [Rhodospirillum sp.]